MAQSDMKLYVAIGVLGVLGAGYFLQTKSKNEAEAARSAAAEKTDLPTIALTEESTGKITKFVINQPAKDGAGGEKTEASANVLVKVGDKWMVDEPVKALANQKNVESLLANLTKLEAKEHISDSKEVHEQYSLTDEKGLHAAFYEGDKLVREIWAGKSGGRGQMARVDGSDAVIVIDGFSSFLYSRNTKGWRDLGIFELDIEEVTGVKVENENGEFAFTKEDGETEWSAKHKKPKAFAASKLKEFDEKQITSLLNAYKTLNASGFGDGMTLVETGLETPVATLTLTMADGATKVVLFGNNAEGSSRYAKVEGGEQIYTVSSWASDWGTADEEKFHTPEAPATPPGGGMPGGMPPGMRMPPGMMPPGH